MEALQIGTGDGRIEFDQRVAALHRGIGSPNHDHPHVDQTMPGIGPVQPGVAEPGRGEMQISDRVTGLHRGDDRQMLEPAVVGRPQDLGVFDAPAHVGAVGPVSGGHGVQGLLVPFRHRSVAPVTDRMGRDLDAAAQGRLVQGDDLVARDLHQAAGFGAVSIGFEQGCAARAEGSVRIIFDRPGDDPAVGDAARAARDQGGGTVGGDAVVDAQRRFARLGHGLEQGNVPPGRAHEMDAGPAIGGLDAEAGAIGVAQGLGIGLRQQAGDQLLGGIDQQAGRPSVRALEDLPARWCHRRGVDAGGGEGR